MIIQLGNAFLCAFFSIQENRFTLLHTVPKAEKWNLQWFLPKTKDSGKLV